jgi:nuclease S1
VNWADEIRRERKETAPWHYVNIPHDAAGYDPTRDARPEGTIISALETQTRMLANKNLPREQRVEALKFVTHFVGDVHQPLHCVDRNGDKGGNAQLVFYRDQKKATNLHRVWDTFILRDAMNGTPVAKYAEQLGASITAEQSAALGSGSAATWAGESQRWPQRLRTQACRRENRLS